MEFAANKKNFVFIAALFLGSKIFAASPAPFQPKYSQTKSIVKTLEFKLNPRVEVDGYTGDNNVIKGQALIPFIGNANETLLGVLEGTDALRKKDGWLAGVGFDYRKVMNNNYILGGYVLGSYNRTLNDRHYWLVNPGFETLWQNYDLRANAYIPVGTTEWKGREVWAEDLGKYNETYRSGHLAFEEKYKLHEQVSYGVDVEVGSKVPFVDSLKMYVGGYYFKTADLGSVTGAEGRVAYKLSKYFTLEVRDSYNKLQHNTVLGGLRIVLGGVDSRQEQAGIAARLMDPIENNFATLGQGYSVPYKVDYQPIGPALLGDNFWYYQPGSNGTRLALIDNDGTYEHPYTEFDQSTIDSIKDYNSKNHKTSTDLYFAGGTYSLSGFANDNIALPQGFNLEGRADHYNRRAMENERPTFIGGITMNEGNNMLDSIIVQKGATGNTTGIAIGENNFGKDRVSARINSNININNVDVTGNYVTGILINNADGVNLRNSKLNINAVDNPPNAYGIYLQNASVNIEDNNLITVNNLNYACGIFTDYNDNLINITGNHNIIKAYSSAYMSGGIILKGRNDVINISGNDNSIITQANSYAFALAAQGNTNENEKIIISGNNNSVAATVFTAGAWSSGISISANKAQVIISGNNNSISALGGDYSVGIGNYSGEGNQIILSGNNTKISAEANQPLVSKPRAYGIVDYGGNTLIDVSNTAFYVKTLAVSSFEIEEAAGIRSTADNDHIKVKNSIFNVQTTNPANAYGIIAYGITDDYRDSLRYNSGNIFNGSIQDGNQVINDDYLKLEKMLREIYF
jgi:hypothetical protein